MLFHINCPDRQTSLRPSVPQHLPSFSCIFAERIFISVNILNKHFAKNNDHAMFNLRQCHAGAAEVEDFSASPAPLFVSSIVKMTETKPRNAPGQRDK